MDQRELLVAANSGDQEAFRALVEPYLALSYRTATLILLDRELARDAVQEALTRTFRRLSQIRPDQPFKPWFTRVVVNEARRLAGRQRRQPLLLEQLPEILAPMGEMPESLVVAQEERRLLWTALADLDDLHRTVLVLRYYQGLTEAEMAHALAVKPGTVKSRLHHARRLLAERMGKATQPERWTTRLMSAVQGRFS